MERDVKGQFIKGKRSDRYWTYERIESEFKKVVSFTVQSLSEDLNSPVIPPVQYFRTHPTYSKICSAMGNHGINRTSLYKEILDDLGYCFPEKKSGYYAFDTVFRGWYEFCGFCFIKTWGIDITPTVKPFIGKNYLNDGLLTDYNIHWEHWGELNKRNPEKLKLYKEGGFKLLSTFDIDARKNNIFWFYNDLKTKLIDLGVVINFEEHENFNPLDLVIGKTLRLKDIYQNVKNFCGDENPRLHHLSSSLFHQVINYFGKFSDFIKFCNDNFGESWVYEEKKDNLNDDPQYLVNTMSKFIKTLGRFPTANEMRENNFQQCLDKIHLHGGFENFKRNSFENGQFVKLVIEILGEDNTPFDKTYDFSNQELFDWAIKYVTKINGGEFPKDERKLRKLWVTDNIAKYLSLSLRKNGNSKYNSWSEFQEDYFGNTHTQAKRFQEKISYEKYKEIRTLLDSGLYTKTKVIELTNSGWGVVGRINRKDKRYNDYSLRYESEIL